MTDAHPGHGLSALAIPAAVVLDFTAGPAALWSCDREACSFNSAAAALFGFAAADFNADGGLWLARVEPGDRDAFTAFCRRSRQSSAAATCRYRFLPHGTARAIDLQENALCFTSSDGASAILSRYAAAGSGRFAHQIGNHLQAIRGEIDLLRLAAGLPQPAADSIAQSIEAIQRLTAEMKQS